MVPADAHVVFCALLVERVGHGQIHPAVGCVPEGQGGDEGCLLVVDVIVFFLAYPSREA